MVNEETPPERVNPIDGEKIARDAHLLPYAYERGAAVIKPVDRGKVTGLALRAMYEQTDMQLDQIRAQIELLARQATEIKERMTVSERIYEAEMHIDPLVGRTYYLYQRAEGTHVLSLVSPEEWGKQPPYDYIATVKLLGDHTWETLERRGAPPTADEE